MEKGCESFKVRCENVIDGKVEMSASAYTTLIKRMCKLENAVSRLEIEAKDLLRDAIRNCSINNLDKQQTLQAIGSMRYGINPDIDKYFYAWNLNEIVKKTIIFDYAEIKELAVSIIMEALREHMNELIDNESDQDASKNDADCSADPSRE